jgi:Tfp pilus assembly protein PilN
VDTLNKNISDLLRGSVTDLPRKGVTSSKSALSILDGKITALNERLKKAEGGSSLSALRVFQMISGAIPPREQLVVDIDDLNISPQRVRMEGRTNSYEAVDKMKSSMEKVSIFKNVQTGNVRKGVRDEIKFSLTFDVLGEQDNI